ncbi:DUF4179 domain-containing protein [Irregularibacter muris]|uniref:DUF4179 domain-containing protein n=1 Tax=Irregularibacter muris TaxID=1796619 RepID=A0AAE3HEZ1_9FIRM|nr:DUF4179 domain-containing protein [Irregularibacter muris]MCR1897928.1 DUF4179 domain-containing protein [Irregularibacter muris]
MMKEKELEKALGEMKSEKITPPAALFDETMKKIKVAETYQKDTFNNYLGIKSPWKQKKLILTIASIMIFVFLGMIRISPVFADFVSHVLKMEVIVELIHHDKGIKDAIDHNNLQGINATDIHEGLAFTVNDILVDQSRMLIFYTVEDLEDHSFIQIADIKFYNEEGKEINIISYPNIIEREKFYVENKISDIIHTSIPTDVKTPKKLYIKLSMMEYDGINNDNSYKNKRIMNSTWTVAMEINQEKVGGSKEYVINKTLDIENNKIHLKKLSIYPTRMRLDFQDDEGNTNLILSFKDLVILDQQGEIYERLADDPYAAIFKDEWESMFFQSNYYKDTRELYLVGKGISLIDKKHQNIKIDVKANRLLSSLDKNMKFLGAEQVESIDEPIRQEGNFVRVKFAIKDKEGSSAENGLGIYDNSFHHQGYISKIFEPEHFPDREYNYELTFTFEALENAQDVLELKIWDYPINIEDEFRIKIK